MNRVVPVVIVILAITAQARRRRVCVLRTNIPHEGVPVPFANPVRTTIPLRIHVRCSARRGRRHPKLSLIILMPGALARPSDYSKIANILARSGFVVAIPSYTTRKLFQALSPIFDAFQEFVQQTRDMGFACSANGQFVSVKLITSVLKFFSARYSPHAGVRKATNLRQTIVFGHTMGGAVSELFFNDVCKPVTEPVVPPPVPLAFNPTAVLRTVCEQFKPFRSPKVKVHGLVTYEGFTGNSTIDPVGTDSFYVVIHSSFFSDRVTDFFGGRDFNGRAATVMVSHANHYAPTNFVTQNDNQRPVCARARPPPEDMFTTTRRIQNKVIKSIARAVKASFRVYVRRKRRKTLRRLTKRSDLLVEKVRFL